MAKSNQIMDVKSSCSCIYGKYLMEACCMLPYTLWASCRDCSPSRRILGESNELEGVG